MKNGRKPQIRKVDGWWVVGIAADDQFLEVGFFHTWPRALRWANGLGGVR